MAGRIPSFSRLQSLCEKLDPLIYDAPTINSVLSRILNQTLESQLLFDDILLDDTCTVVLPLAICNRLCPDVNKAFIDTLASCSLNQELSPESAPHFIISDGVTFNALTGTFVVDHADWREDVSLALPTTVSSKWSVVDNLESILAEMEGECSSLHQAVFKVQEQFADDLVFLDQAYESAADYESYQLPQKAYHALRVLGEVCHQFRQHPLGNKDIAAAIRERLGSKSFASDVSEAAKNRFSSDYERTYNNETVQLGPHISLGRGNAANVLRIYFYIAEDLKFVVGHVGHHLRD